MPTFATTYNARGHCAACPTAGMKTRSKSANAPSASGRSSLRTEQALAIARERGGTLISESVPDVSTEVVWQCANGHRWTARLHKVRRGTWCPTCAHVGSVTIEDMRTLAAERLGECLSQEYSNNHTPLRWRCAEFHEWLAKPRNVHRTWCPVCSKRQKLELKELRKIARARGGLLISRLYVNNSEPLIWSCAAGHVWLAPATQVKPGRFTKGTWCPSCPRSYKGRRWLSIEDMQHLAGDRGGECLSTTYVNSITKLRWRCGEGHEWQARPASVKYGVWCPVCAGTQKLTLESVREEAAKHGGKLLSDEYIGALSPLLWECAEGHRWEVSASGVRGGSWCPHCAGKVRLSIEEMRDRARANGGECLSKRYVNRTTHLRWRCAKGHVWRATPGSVGSTSSQKRGSWCSVCARV